MTATAGSPGCRRARRADPPARPRARARTPAAPTDRAGSLATMRDWLGADRLAECRPGPASGPRSRRARAGTRRRRLGLAAARRLSPDPRALAALLAEVARDPEIALAGPKVLGLGDRRLTARGRSDDLPQRAPRHRPRAPRARPGPARRHPPGARRRHRGDAGAARRLGRARRARPRPAADARRRRPRLAGQPGRPPGGRRHRRRHAPRGGRQPPPPAGRTSPVGGCTGWTGSTRCGCCSPTCRWSGCRSRCCGSPSTTLFRSLGLLAGKRPAHAADEARALLALWSGRTGWCGRGRPAGTPPGALPHGHAAAGGPRRRRPAGHGDAQPLRRHPARRGGGRRAPGRVAVGRDRADRRRTPRT